jgi:hypothetical protein
MAGKFISSNSTVRETVALLKEEKRLVREIEAKIVEQSMADAAHKKMMSEHRIATKMAKIHGHEPPPPIGPATPEVAVEVAAPPVVEPEVASEPPPKKAPAKKAPAKKATAKKAAPKKSPRKKG